ncbi:MAG: DUF5829 family protein, partial [Planctomycetota bacterium]
MYLLAALALVSLASAQERPALLPPTPAGWRYERLEFPLSFAPELNFAGYEELRFAPGMFEPGTDTYFTYILGVRLEQELVVDLEFVESFLHAYYRGLCREVGQGRGLDLDLSKFSVTVEQDGSQFLAMVEMFDPFVTGEPLTLRVEFAAHAAAQGTELFGLASPAPRDAPLWEQLHTFAERWRAVRPAPVFLNHVYVIPDVETHAAIAASKFLAQAFGSFEERTTVRADMSYTGIYFYARETYIEFLPPNSSVGLGQGSSGVAFGIERTGGTQVLAGELEERGLRSFVGPISREWGGEQVPWFKMLSLEKAHAASQLSLFSLEYDPRFLAEWHPDLPPQRGGILRGQVLGRYAAKLGQREPHAEALIEDVREVHLSLDERQRGRLLDACRVFGYVVEAAADTWICDGPCVRLVVRESKDPGGVTA